MGSRRANADAIDKHSRRASPRAFRQGSRMKVEQPWLVLGLCFLLGFSGCGSAGPEVAPVRGMVTYQGAPLKEGGITFVPMEGRSAFGRIVDGQIVEVTTNTTGDGVIVGKAAVGIQATTNLGKMQGPHRPIIPQRYFDPATANLSAEIKAGDSNDLKFDLVD